MCMGFEIIWALSARTFACHTLAIATCVPDSHFSTSGKTNAFSIEFGARGNVNALAPTMSVAWRCCVRGSAGYAASLSDDFFGRLALQLAQAGIISAGLSHLVDLISSGLFRQPIESSRDQLSPRRADGAGQDPALVRWGGGVLLEEEPAPSHTRCKRMRTLGIGDWCWNLPCVPLRPSPAAPELPTIHSSARCSAQAAAS
jgi:hypothetical protein